MAEYDSAGSSDLVNMSKELENEDRGPRHSTRGGRGRGKGSGVREGSGGGRAGGGMNREVAVSKALSKLLRHAAEDVGLTLDGEGFARVDQVVSVYDFALGALILQRSLSIVFSSHV
jgi:2'-phosphotransferase